MRYGARGLRGVLMRRMDGERHRRGRRAPRYGLSVHTTATVPSAAAASARIGSRYSILSSSSSCPPARPVLPILPTGYRQVSTGDDWIDDHRRMVPQCGADIPVCAGSRGQAVLPAPTTFYYAIPTTHATSTTQFPLSCVPDSKTSSIRATSRPFAAPLSPRSPFLCTRHAVRLLTTPHLSAHSSIRGSHPWRTWRLGG